MNTNQTPRKPGAGGKLQEDELVQSLLPDPNQQCEDSYVITGWLGKSTQKGFWRLYPTPELDEYLEISEKDILASRPIDYSISPLGGTVLVVKAKAELRGASLAAVDARTAFLQGDITASSVTSSTADPDKLEFGPVFNRNFTKGFWCTVSMFFACTTHVVRNPVCTTASGKLCGTRRFLP